MKLNINRTIYPLLFVLFIFSSCGGPRIDGTNSKTFKESADKIRSGLSRVDTITFNNALRVIVGSTIGERMRDDKKYPGMTLDSIVMQKIDGKTFGEIKSIANDTLKAEKQQQIASAQQDINDLQAGMKKRKAAYDALKAKLSVIQGSLVKIDMQGGTIVMSCVFKNVSKKDLDHYTLATIATSNSKKTLFYSSTHFWGGVKTIHPQDTVMEYLTLGKYEMDKVPEVPWATIKYPVTDPGKYNFTVKAYAAELQIDDADYDLSTVKWSESDQDDYDKTLKELQDKLKTVQASKDNLDEF